MSEDMKTTCSELVLPAGPIALELVIAVEPAMVLAEEFQDEAMQRKRARPGQAVAVKLTVGGRIVYEKRAMITVETLGKEGFRQTVRLGQAEETSAEKDRRVQAQTVIDQYRRDS